MNKKTKKRVVAVRMDAADYDRLAAVAHSYGLLVARVSRTAIVLGLERLESEPWPMVKREK
jgi:hypothetical protein